MALEDFAMSARPAAVTSSPLSDLELVGRVQAGDAGAMEPLMRRHNRALYRTARAILRDDAEAEDAVQDAYLQAFRNLEAFRGDAMTQAAVHWVLACTFLRFIEDNELVERPWLAGPGTRMALARDRHVEYFRRSPRDSDVEYLLAAFKDAAALPGLAGLFHGEHNPLFRLPVSADGARGLIAFLQKENAKTSYPST
jgi:DNA-directed RNA polymerase specialized sigma24 family protein